MKAAGKALNKLRALDWSPVAFFICITLLGILLRVTLFPYVSSDYRQFLHDWFYTLKIHKGLRALGMEIGDYTPPYLYILKILTYLPVPPVPAIKIGSCAADIVLAWFVMRIVYLRRRSESIALLAYAAVLFLPTVFLNSAAWAQCDAIYTAGLAACVYYMLRDRPKAAMVAFAIAFCFKLQAIFLFPFLMVMWIKNKVSFHHFFMIPLVYIAAILPAALGGRGFVNLLTVYCRQTGTYTSLSMNAPNLYTWLPDEHWRMFGALGIVLTAAVVLISLYLAWKTEFEISPDILIAVALLSAVLMPFCLPHMHERYFYPADVLSVVYLFYFPRKIHVPFIMVSCSSYVVCNFLFGTYFIPVPCLGLAVLLLILLLIKDLVKLVLRPKAPREALSRTCSSP